MNQSIRRPANGNIIWLASYPKSGNTWFRVFLSNLFSEQEEMMDINALSLSPIASCRTHFENTLALESSYFSNDEIDLIRPEFYRSLSADTPAGEVSYHKIHDAFTENLNGEWLFPPEIALCAIYFMRNPLDVAVSAANHFACSIDKAIKNLNNSYFALADNTSSLPAQLRQRLLSWSDHVLSWTNAPVDVLIVRYEDMKFDTFNTFRKVVDFIGIDKSYEDIQSAIDKSSFNVLRRQEEQYGFKEKPQNADSFFRKGEVGDWRNHLNASQIKALLDCHSVVMEQFGYLKNGEPVY